MDSNILTLMLGISTFLGALGLGALLWGLKTGQFDDQRRFLDSVHYDNEDDLNDAVQMEKKRLEAKKKREKEYRPPD
jgi:cbb3-type cytochrome oxidase maturation protein